MSDLSLRLLCEQLVDLQNQKSALETEIQTLDKEIDRLRLLAIPELMDTLGVKNATFEGLGRVQLASDIYASTRAGKKEDGITWLRDCGYDGMISEGYNASSLKALFRAMLVKGEPIPDDIFNVTPFIRASVVKA